MAFRKATTVGVTVGERIRSALDKLGMTAPELARKMRVSHTTVYDWLHDRSAIRNDKIPRLASILGVDASALTPFGGGESAPTGGGFKKNWIVLVGWTDLDALDAMRVTKRPRMGALRRLTYIEADPGISSRCIAVTLPDNSMEGEGAKTFRKEDIVIFDPEITPWRGSYVLARLHKTGEYVFRQLMPRGSSAWDLMALNAAEYPTITINRKFGADIKGVLVEHRERFYKPQTS